MNEQTKKTPKPVHLVITDNKTGETIKALDFDALVCAAHTGEHECGGIMVSRCSTKVLAETLMGAEYTVKQMEELDPMAALAKTLLTHTTQMVQQPQNQEDQKPEAQE